MDVYSKDYDPKSLFDLSGKTAFVTGASMGLGYRFAWTLAKAGAKMPSTNAKDPITTNCSKKLRRKNIHKSKTITDVRIP